MPSRATSVANRAAAKKKDRKYSDVLLKQVAELRSKHPGMIAFVRIGASFDVIGEDADVVANVLGLKVWPDGDTKYVTFPADELDARLAVMLRAGKRCAVCEPNVASVTYVELEPEPEPEPVTSPVAAAPEVRVIALVR